MSPIVVLIAAYFVVLAGLSAGAMPYRRRLREIGADLCASNLSPLERGMVEGMLRHAYSWRMAIVLFFVFAAGLFQSGDTIDRDAGRAESENFMGDYRFHQFAEAFFASVVGVNPVFGMLAILAKWAFSLKMRLHHNSKSAQQIADIRTAMTV